MLPTLTATFTVLRVQGDTCTETHPTLRALIERAAGLAAVHQALVQITLWDEVFFVSPEGVLTLTPAAAQQVGENAIDALHYRMGR
jgi:hypothetical protein